MQDAASLSTERGRGSVLGGRSALFDYPYLLWVALLPFGIDVIYVFTYQHPPVFGVPPAGIYTILLLPMLLLSIAVPGVEKRKIDIPFAFFALILLHLLILPLVGLRSQLGYYSVLYALVLALLLIRPPTRENVTLGIEVLMGTLFLLIVVSLLVLPVLPGALVEVNPIRTPWVYLLPGPLGRAEGLFRGPGVFGLFCCLLICFGCLRGGWKSFVYGIPAAAGLLLSDSRSAFLALGLTSFVALAIIVVRDRRDWLRGHAAKGFLVGLAYAAAFFAILGPGFFSGDSHRLYIWKEALDHRDLSGEDFSHPHNFLLAALDTPPFLISALLVLAAIALVVAGLIALRRGNLMTVILLGPTLVYSSFEFGIHWERLNIPTMVVLFGLLALRFDGTWERDSAVFAPSSTTAV